VAFGLLSEEGVGPPQGRCPDYRGKLTFPLEEGDATRCLGTVPIAGFFVPFREI